MLSILIESVEFESGNALITFRWLLSTTHETNVLHAGFDSVFNNRVM